MNRILRPAALVLLLLSASCATGPRAAAPRDAFPLDPREGLAGPFPGGVETGWQALLSGDAARARAEFLRGEGPEQNRAARVGVIEALVEERSLPEALALCGKTLSVGEPTAPLLVACGEAHARSGQALSAWELYRRALARAGGRPGLEARGAELRSQAREALRGEAQEAAGRKDWKAAREKAGRAVEIDPASAPARETAGDVELAAGDRAAALARYREALDLARGDRALREKVAKLALQMSDYATAIPVLDALAAEDPRFAAQAEDARFAFRVANWPAAERTAARADRLTRGDAARLVWWMVPEVRGAKVTSAVIASDVVGRPDRQEIAKAVSLGLLEMDQDTHSARPDDPLTFSAAARLYLRVLGLLRPRETLECLGGQPAERISGGEAIRIARDCRILGEKDAPPVGGPAFIRALDRVRALAGGGENGPPGNERKKP